MWYGTEELVDFLREVSYGECRESIRVGILEGRGRGYRGGEGVERKGYYFYRFYNLFGLMFGFVIFVFRISRVGMGGLVFC